MSPNVSPSTKLISKYLENLERIQTLVSGKPPTCHNGDTMCLTKNRIPRCTPQTFTKFITKFSALTIKRSVQDTSYGARMKKKQTKQKYIKALILVLGLLQVVGTVIKALILVLSLLQVVGTVKSHSFSTGPTISSRHSKNNP